MKESYKKFITYCVWMAIIFFVIRCLMSQKDIHDCVKAETWGALAYNVLGYAGEAIGIMFIFMSVFNAYAWKWKWINILVDMPVLAKKYTGSLVSDREGENKRYDANLEVIQTFLNVSIVLKTKESRSYSVISSIDTVCDSKKIVYVYQNEPNAEIMDRSAIHKGTAELWIEKSGELNGNYYTSRKTRGSIHFEPITDKSNKCSRKKRTSFSGSRGNVNTSQRAAGNVINNYCDTDALINSTRYEALAMHLNRLQDQQ